MCEPASVRMLVFDVDGVLTDGSILLNDHGIESKRFHVRDGFAIRAAMSVGMKIGVLTGRKSRVVALRMAELGVDLLMQGVHEKAAGFETLCRLAAVSPHETAYVGDDLVDLPAMRRSGFPMAVLDAAAEVREAARFVTKVPGGCAAARDAIEYILRAQHRWEEVVEKYAV